MYIQDEQISFFLDFKVTSKQKSNLKKASENSRNPMKYGIQESH